MSLLWRLVFFNRCTSTHHKLALDSLRFVRGPQADLWANLFLANHEQFLTGSKAPDNDFKDFKNHVLHVEDGFWGGATTAARTWYQKTVAALSVGDWPEAVYNAGVLSHYFTDPFQPFHTGQTEAEGRVHRAAEWSICKSYDDLKTILEQDLAGYPEWELTPRPDWLEEAIRQGAIEAHKSYTVCIDHYDLGRGIKHPPSGLDQEMKDRLARLIGLAAVGFSRVLERAFEESGSSPPDVAVSLHVFLATIKMPLNWIMRKLTDLHERSVVEAIYLEVQEKGKVIDALPEDERQVRRLYAQEVLKVPVRQLDAAPAANTGTQYGTGTPPRGQSSVKPTTAPGGFQRTVTSAPQWVDVPRGAAAPIESCLTVPLAVAAQPNPVADAVVQAYLTMPVAAAPVDAGSLQHVAEDAKVGTKDGGISRTENGADAGGIRPAARGGDRPSMLQPAPAPPTTRDLDRDERRLKKRLQQPIVSEPDLAPPVPLLNPTDLSTALTTPEIPAEMFAPLPVMPRVAVRDQRPPQTAEKTPPQPNPVPKPVVIPTQARRPVTPPAAPVVEPAPRDQRDRKTYQAQPPATNVVPTPHLRVPEPHPADSTMREDWRNDRSEGQVAGFRFESLSPTGPSPDTPLPSGPLPAGPARISPAPFRQSVVEAQLSASPDETPKPSLNASRRFYLDLAHPVVDAPSIGPKTAERLEMIGIDTIADLLRADPRQAAIQMGNPTAETVIREWQAQTSLVCRVPNLRGHDAQFLVACGVTTPEQLQGCEPRKLLQQVATYLRTSAGQRLLRGGTAPDLTEVTEWIIAARDARPLGV